MAKGTNLNDRQRAFVESYLQCWNASEAARRAGYKGKNADVVASRMLVHVGIREEIERRLSEMAMGANEVLARLSDHAKGTLAYFTDGNTIDLSTDKAKEHFHLLKKCKTKMRRFKQGDEIVTETEIEIEIHDPQAALVHLGRYHKLFTDKMEVDDSGLTDEERANRITAILDRARARRT